MDSQRILKQSASMYLLVHGLIQTKKSIPFWAMYTNDMHGVRIGLPKNPFKKYTWKENPYNNSSPEKNEFPISEKQAKGKNYFISPFYEKIFSVQVKYSNNKD